jgi:hypothetical protein
MVTAKPDELRKAVRRVMRQIGYVQSSEWQLKAISERQDAYLKSLGVCPEIRKRIRRGEACHYGYLHKFLLPFMRTGNLTLLPDRENHQ